MTLSKFSVFDIRIKLLKLESKTGYPIYVIKYFRGDVKVPLSVHHSISYTREQAFFIYRTMVAYLIKRYLYLH